MDISLAAVFIEGSVRFGTTLLHAVIDNPAYLLIPVGLVVLAILEKRAPRKRRSRRGRTGTSC
ncbi:hypothetical protein [Leifsonia sp. A12D58]|uniref:hypothetical protein n=1 Tax=Leifsonia sp. A12D58 TaxID=3397674 RepID=UPI0039E11B98